MSLPKMKPLTEKRLEQLERRTESSGASVTVGICVMADDNIKSWYLTSSDLAALLQEVRRRRKKMGYTEKGK